MIENNDKKSLKIIDENAQNTKQAIRQKNEQAKQNFSLFAYYNGNFVCIALRFRYGDSGYLIGNNMIKHKS